MSSISKRMALISRMQCIGILLIFFCSLSIGLSGKSFNNGILISQQDPEDSVVVRYVKSIRSKDYNVEFTYDTEGNLTAATEKDGTTIARYTYTYVDNFISIARDGEVFAVIAIGNNSLKVKNKQGNMVLEDLYTLSDDLKVVKVEQFASNATYIWKDGNMIQMKTDVGESNSKYLAKKNRPVNVDIVNFVSSVFYPWYYCAFHWGQATNLLQRIVDDNIDKNFIYEFDAKGYITKIKSTSIVDVGFGERKDVEDYQITYCD